MTATQQDPVELAQEHASYAVNEINGKNSISACMLSGSINLSETIREEFRGVSDSWVMSCLHSYDIEFNRLLTKKQRNQLKKETSK
jgi:hypothetical protein